MNDTHNIIINLGVIVIIVLIFLIFIQIRKGNKIKRDNMELSLRRQFMDLQLVLSQNEDLANLYQRGLLGFTGLSDTEQTRFFIVAAYAFTHWSEVKRMADGGLISQDYLDETRKQLKDFVQYPGVQAFWEYRKHWYPQETQDLIKELINESPEKVTPIYPESSV